MTMRQQLHASATHKTGADRSCPLCAAGIPVGIAVHRLGIFHGRAEYRRGKWIHVERPAWFEGTPVLEASGMEELRRLIIEAGERLYGVRK